MKNLRAWLELLRLPNLFTVPGDVLAAAVIAAAGGPHWDSAGILVLFSLMLYAAGLFLNDYTDREEDARTRPQRPIPSGRILSRHVLIVAVALLILPTAGSLVLAWVAPLPITHLWLRAAGITAGIAFLVVVYNRWARRIPAVGFGVMGACRGMNVLLGACATAEPLWIPVIFAAAAETLYIVTVSAYAYGETDGQPAGARRVLPLAGLPAFFALLRFTENQAAALLLFVAAAWWTVRALFKHGVPPPERVGLLIRGLLLLQAFMAAIAAASLLPMAVLLLFFLISSFVGRRFYGS